MSAFYQLCGGAHQAAGVDAIVVGKIIVLGRQQGADEIRRNVGKTDRCAAHFAELRDEFFIAAVDPQRNLQLDTSKGLYRRQTRTKVEVRPAEHEQQPADDGDNGVPEKLQQTNQGFWISREKNGLGVGACMANDGSTRAADKKREKTLGIKAFSAWGVIRASATSRPNARRPAATRRYDRQCSREFYGKGIIQAKSRYLAGHRYQ